MWVKTYIYIKNQLLFNLKSWFARVLLLLFSFLIYVLYSCANFAKKINSFSADFFFNYDLTCHYSKIKIFSFPLVNMTDFLLISCEVGKS